jgi:hypothetical protein
MRWIAALVLVVAGLPTSGASEAGGVSIVELLADPDTASGQREFVELLNAGPGTVDLDGWSIADAAGNRFVFPAWSLEAGRRLVVWGGGQGDAVGPAWNLASVWNNAGDTLTLSSPAGTVTDWLSYGSARSSSPPPGFSSASHPAAAPRGSALALDGEWKAAAPTPGTSPGAVGGSASADVDNMAPTATLGALPDAVAAGESVTITFTIEDANGGADVASWRLSADGADLAVGTGGGSFEHTATAPSAGPWTIRVAATDTAGATGQAEAQVAVKVAGLNVIAPPEGRLLFPPMAPGERNVTSSNGFWIRNDGATDLVPLFDLSDFRGPATIAVTDNCWIGIGEDGDHGDILWVPYSGPLTPLPALRPGANVTLQLRLAEIPEPAPAGSYHTSFSLVAT